MQWSGSIRLAWILFSFRHPNILTFIDGLEIDASGQAVGFIVTEEVTPLEEALKELSNYPGSISWGLYQIAVSIQDRNFANSIRKRFLSSIMIAIWFMGIWIEQQFM